MKWMRSGTWALLVGGFGFYLLLTNGGLINEPGFERSTPVTAEPAETKNIATPAPDFTLQNLQGETVKLSELRGKTVILNFWTSWCPPCREEMPELQAFHTEYVKDHPNTVLLGINLTKEDHGEDKIQSFKEEIGLTFPLLLDSEGQTQKAYQLLTIPTTFIIDEQGNIKEKIMGPVTKNQLIKETEG
ncbi:peroxiredoxin family protein [Jeotgalibacillus proteolyticus]|nr:TlpA family protein disulfide reductase [Jeotgalibacillus proteolyticus]